MLGSPVKMSSSNKTEPLEGLVLCLFEIEVFEEQWVDPYDSVLLKVGTICIQAVDVIAVMIMLAFVAFETKGLAGHYRTLINQLLSYLYGVVSTRPSKYNIVL